MSVWTDERVATLKQLWPTELSAKQIAERLGLSPKQRSSVISKARRLKLASRQAQPSRKATKRKRLIVKPPRPLEQQPNFGPTNRMRVAPMDVTIIHAEDPPPAEWVSFDKLEERHCKWPLGDPCSSEFGHCGRPRVPLSPYCQSHTARSRQAVPPRKPRTSSGSHRAPVNEEFA